MTSVGALDAAHPRRARVTIASAWAPVGLLIVGLAAGALLMYLTRGTSFWFDEWNFILYRRGDDAGAFLQSYNGHFSLVPVALYHLLFATAGLRHYAVYRAVVIVAHLLCVALVFVYVRRRLPDLLAVALAALVLFFGAGWQDFLWPFQTAWLISLGAGIAMLLALERHDRRGDVAACLLLALSLSSSGIGIVVAIGAVVEVLGGRRARGGSWAVLTPLIPYAVWWATDQHASRHSHLSQIPHFFVNAAGAAVAGLVGRPGTMSASGGQLLTWGRPLVAVAGVALVVWLVVRRRGTTRLLTLLAMVLGFWLATAYTRAFLFHGDQAWASRYVYLGGVLLVLVLAEVLRTVPLSIPVQGVLAAVVLAAIVSNVTENLRPGAAYLRDQGAQTRADLGALQIGRPVMVSGYSLAYLPGAQFLHLRAASLLAATRSLGSPADSPAQIAAAPASARRVADLELIRMHGVALTPLSGAPTLGPRPRLVARPAGSAVASASCLRFTPGAAGPGHLLDVTLPGSGLLVRALHGDIAVGVRRFASDFVAVGSLVSRHSARLRIASDGRVDAVAGQRRHDRHG